MAVTTTGFGGLERGAKPGASSPPPTSWPGCSGPAGLVARGQHGAHRGAGRVGVHADAPVDLTADLTLYVRCGLRVGALGERVLGVVEHPRLDADGGQGVAERGDRAVADTLDLLRFPVGGYLRDERVLGLHDRGTLVTQQAQRPFGQVLG